MSRMVVPFFACRMPRAARQRPPTRADGGADGMELRLDGASCCLVLVVWCGEGKRAGAD
ncbi:MAG: hypothetical protein SOI26_06910 [Coriobacteriales bacterium]